MPAARLEFVRHKFATEHAQHGRAQHDVRERDVERKYRNERGGRNRPQHRVSQRARADAVGREQHDGSNGGLDAVEQSSHGGQVAERQIDPGQPDQDEQRWQHKQHACRDAALDAVHQPADIGGKLLCLGAGQHHAEIERVQKALLGNPASPFHQFHVHHGNLPGRAAKADEAEFEPVGK